MVERSPVEHFSEELDVAARSSASAVMENFPELPASEAFAAGFKAGAAYVMARLILEKSEALDS